MHRMAGLRLARVVAVALAVAAISGAASGCQAVLGIDSRHEDPLRDGCTLPEDGAAKLRVADLLPSSDHVDFCVRPSGGAWGRPILRGGGTAAACQVGFGYPDVSRPFGAPLGKVDVEAIAAGGTCSAPALSEIDGVVTNADHAVSVFLIGGAGQPERLVAFDDQPKVSDSTLSLRFLHAAVGLQPLRIGLTVDARLPTTLVTQLVDNPIAFGAVPAGHSSIGEIHDGYLTVPASDSRVGASPVDDPRAVLVQQVAHSDSLVTLIAVGNAGDAAFPVRGQFCDELAPSPDGIRAACRLSDLATLSVDIWAAGLYGAFAPSESSRRDAIRDAIRARDSDVLCIGSVSRKADRDAFIAAGVAGALPFSVVGSTDLDTVANDPRDQAGVTPAAPSAPPCGGTVSPSDVDAAYQCMIQNCNTGTDDSGGLSAGDCLTSKCVFPLLQLYSGSDDAKRCFDCITGYAISDVTYAKSRSSCTTDSRAAFTFGGESPSLLLSRFPIVDQETYVLPATTWRRVVYYAKLQIEPTRTVDFYCAQLAPLVGQAMPYVGPYAGGNPDGWAGEQTLQAKKTVAYVKAKSGTNPAIIVGDWAASLDSPSGVDGGVDGVVASNPDTIRVLQDAFGAEVVPPTLAASPQCTLCPTPINPYNTAGVDFWNLRPYTINMKAGSATSATVLLKDAVVSLPSGARGPLSDNFLFNVQILRP